MFYTTIYIIFVSKLLIEKNLNKLKGYFWKFQLNVIKKQLLKVIPIVYCKVKSLTKLGEISLKSPQLS